MVVEKLVELYSSLQKVEFEILELREGLAKSDGSAGPGSDFYNHWIDYHINEKAKILVKIKELERYDFASKVLLLLYQNKVEDAKEVLEKELECVNKNGG